MLMHVTALLALGGYPGGVFQISFFFLIDQGVRFPLALFLLLWGGGGGKGCPFLILKSIF